MRMALVVSVDSSRVMHSALCVPSQGCRVVLRPRPRSPMPSLTKPLDGNIILDFKLQVLPIRQVEDGLLGSKNAQLVAELVPEG